MVAKISQIVKVLFYTNRSYLKSTKVNATIECRDVRCTCVGSNGCVFNSAVSKGQAAVPSYATFGFVFDFPVVIDGCKERIEFYYVLKFCIFANSIKIWVFEFGRFYGCP